MNISKLAALSLVLAGSLGAGLAHAGSDVQWSVSIPGPIGVSLYSQPYDALVYVQPRQVYAPVYVQPGYRTVRHDHDRDGIPDRFDRRYNPRWDRDGDGIPNRYDRRYNPAWDRDGDGIPNRRDRRDDRGHGR